MTPDELRAEPATMSVERAAEAFGVSLWKARRMITSGEWPTRVLRFGRCIKIPTAEVAAVLGIPYGGADQQHDQQHQVVPDDVPRIGPAGRRPRTGRAGGAG